MYATVYEFALFIMFIHKKPDFHLKSGFPALQVLFCLNLTGHSALPFWDVQYYSSSASVVSAAASSFCSAFMLRLIFLSSPLKSTTFAVITCPTLSTSDGLSTCSWEICDTWTIVIYTMRSSTVIMCSNNNRLFTFPLFYFFGSYYHITFPIP